MKRTILKKAQQHLPIILLILSLLACTFAFGDVGNQNRYTSGGGGSGFDGDGLGALVGYLLGLFIENPTMGIIVFFILVILVLVYRRKNKKQASDPGYIKVLSPQSTTVSHARNGRRGAPFG